MRKINNHTVYFKTYEQGLVRRKCPYQKYSPASLEAFSLCPTDEIALYLQYKRRKLYKSSVILSNHSSSPCSYITPCLSYFVTFLHYPARSIF